MISKKSFRFGYRSCYHPSITVLTEKLVKFNCCKIWSLYVADQKLTLNTKTILIKMNLRNQLPQTNSHVLPSLHPMSPAIICQPTDIPLKHPPLLLHSCRPLLAQIFHQQKFSLYPMPLISLVTPRQFRIFTFMFWVFDRHPGFLLHFKSLQHVHNVYMQFSCNKYKKNRM